MKKVALHTLGCKVNFAETAQIKDKFEQMGYQVGANGSLADIVLINTCSVTNNADVEARKLIRRLKRESPKAFLGVMGCYAQLKPEEVASIEGVDAVFGQREKFRIPTLINDILGGEKTQVNVSCIDDLPFDGAVTTDNELRTRAFFKMQDGCNYFCTFCTIPYARGNSRSMEIERIPQHIYKIVESGYKEVVISGINLGDYQAPGGEKFKDVVSLIDKMDIDLRVRISSIEPNLLNDDILSTVAGSNIFCPHFHIPLQSGSPEILRKMKRRYKAEYYRNLIYKIKVQIPNCGIGVDVIVGFPGETDEHFMQTYDLLNELPVSYLHVFTYSERDNTPAASFEGKVPVNIRKERTRKLRELSIEKQRKFYLEQVGKILTVIPETYLPVENMWKSWSENYVRVKFEAPREINKDFYKVKINSAAGEYAYGELI
ncbi:MAG: tRNA (N(6)-L-threonylcarbamoyladenosine(37)-C(2))-methylthiotransferase MtaB [Candidatus Kapabacteria bacterium]|nr:tRNA (N(6)-L-threonylcarbamoyladenosine(37)-C(2))-methylthiotransferase MtaB [Ignavibacteriota bacterium]MCW5885960.1 tRNA (N(6)-L-threonylcarbamoyladenosine(37)-C(2))-methylthiotransferase MtaB [Candidatus Kapabacteria bacterium]